MDFKDIAAYNYTLVGTIPAGDTWDTLTTNTIVFYKSANVLSIEATVLPVDNATAAYVPGVLADLWITGLSYNRANLVASTYDKRRWQFSNNQLVASIGQTASPNTDIIVAGECHVDATHINDIFVVVHFSIFYSISQLKMLV